MKPAHANTVIDRIVDNVLETRLDDLAPADIDHAKDRILDTLGCAMGGARDGGNPQLVGLMSGWGGNQEATILVHGDKVPAHNAAMMNSIMARSFDFEPVSPVVHGMSVPGHISGSTVLTAVAVGEVTKSSGKDLLAALVVGDDLSARISVVGSGPGIGGGRDRVGPMNLFGTAAIAGRLLGLTHEQMRNALGLLLVHCGGSHQMIVDKTTGFKLPQGTSARDGIICAQMAKVGWTGAEDSLLSEFGYFNLFGQGRDPELLVKDLGERYYSDSTFKPYPCCRLNHSAIDSALAIVGRERIEASDIKEVFIEVPRPVLDDVLGRPFSVGSFPHAGAIFSLQYTVACALLRRSVRPEHFTESAIRDPGMADLVARMTMRELKQGHLESARISVVTTGGKEYSEFTDVAKGDPLNPMTKDELVDKFWTNVEFAGLPPRDKAERALALIEDLENVDDIDELVSAMTVDRE
jgi:2-methylcitrate dehydratase PrpD